MSRLVLIDGNAILHRAYHALPPLTNRNGQQVNAVYGFGSIMLRIIDELKPEYLAVAFDRPEPTFRKQLYIGYQSKRKEMEAELAGQVDLVHELVKSFGVQVFEKAGYEADDVLGTIARLTTESTTSITPLCPSDFEGQASTTGTTSKDHKHQASNTKLQINSKSKIQNSKIKIDNCIDSGLHRNDIEEVDEVVIVTGDRDLMQLVNDKVKLYMPTRGMSAGEMVNEVGVKERLGILPSQVVDYKALVGDGSDNYPGIIGVGPKGALDLLNKFGNFGNIVKAVKASDKRLITENTETGEDGTEIADSVKLKILNGLEGGELSYRLATIKTDVEVELDLERLRVEGLNKNRLAEFFRQMGFRSLVKRLGGDDRGNRRDKGDRGKTGNTISENQQSLF